MNTLVACVLGWVLLAPFASLAEDQKFREFLTRDGDHEHLKHRLELRDEQAGFAGTSGRKWVVEPDGHWSLCDLRPAGSGKSREVPIRSGQLKPDALVALAKDLAAHDLLGLPANHGEKPRINPHRIVLKFGDKQVVLNGIIPRRKDETNRDIIAKSAPREDSPAAKIWNRWSALAHSIESRTTEPKP